MAQFDFGIDKSLGVSWKNGYLNFQQKLTGCNINIWQCQSSGLDFYPLFPQPPDLDSSKSVITWPTDAPKRSTYAANFV